MTRLLIFFTIGLLLTASAGTGKGQMDEKPDKVAEHLEDAKKAYLKTADTAAEKLLDAFKQQTSRIEENKTLPVQKQLNLLQELATQKAAFEVDRTKLPDAKEPELANLRSARLKYEAVMNDSRQKCEQAYDGAAKAYRDQKKFNLVMQVLAEKRQFFINPGRGFAGTYLFFPEKKEIVFTRDGKVLLPGPPPKQIGTWEHLGATCEIRYESGWKDVVSFDKNGKDLIGKSYSPKGKQSGTPIFKAVSERN